MRKKETKSERVRNPFPPIFDASSRVLILGSLPSETSRAAGFYYMHPRNRFWSVLSIILDQDLVKMTPEEKASVLKRSGIALYDVVESCEIHRSDDSSITGVEQANIPKILSEAPIRRILLNGKKAYTLFLKFFPEYADSAFCLPSTSPANAKDSLETLLRAWENALAPYIFPKSP